MKKYLGDAVYFDVDGMGRVVLTTENGVSVSNEIILEPEVLNALLNAVHIAPASIYTKWSDGSYRVHWRPPNMVPGAVLLVDGEMIWIDPAGLERRPDGTVRIVQEHNE